MADLIHNPFVACLLVIAVLVSLMTRDWPNITEMRARVVTAVLVTVAALWTAWASATVALDYATVVSGQVIIGSAGIEVPPSTRHLNLLVRGKIPDSVGDSALRTDYTLSLNDKAGVITTLSGTLEEHWETRKVGRRSSSKALVGKMDNRHDLEPLWIANGLTIKLEKQTGALTTPLEVEVIPAPLPGWLLGVLAVLFTAVGAWVDITSNRHTHLALYAAILGMFGVMLLPTVTPASESRAVLGAVVAALAVGLLVGWIVRALMRGFIKPSVADEVVKAPIKKPSDY